jgi:hypothetical protein
MRNARAAVWFAVDRKNLVLSTLAPSSLPTKQVADRFASECGGTLIRPRDIGTHCRNGPGGLAGGVTRSRRDIGARPAEILAMLGARPQFINAAPVAMPSGQAAGQWKGA